MRSVLSRFKISPSTKIETAIKNPIAYLPVFLFCRFSYSPFSVNSDPFSSRISQVGRKIRDFNVTAYFSPPLANKVLNSLFMSNSACCSFFAFFLSIRYMLSKGNAKRNASSKWTAIGREHTVSVIKRSSEFSERFTLPWYVTGALRSIWSSPRRTSGFPKRS